MRVDTLNSFSKATPWPVHVHIIKWLMCRKLFLNKFFIYSRSSNSTNVVNTGMQEVPDVTSISIRTTMITNIVKIRKQFWERNAAGENVGERGRKVSLTASVI